MVDQTKDVFKTDETPKDLFAELVGEGKKYKTEQDLARSRLEADIHIRKLELENGTLREQVVGAKSVADILEAVKANTALVSNPPKNESEDEIVQQPSVSADQVAKIVAEQLTGRETARQKEDNKTKANTLLIGMFGDKAKEIFDKEATDPQVRANLIQLAEINPEKFAQYFKRSSGNSVVDVGGEKNVNIVVQSQNGTAEHGTQAFYSNLRKTNPKLYYSPANQLEMHRAALANPDKYFGE